MKKIVCVLLLCGMLTVFLQGCEKTPTEVAGSSDSASDIADAQSSETFSETHNAYISYIQEIYRKDKDASWKKYLFKDLDGDGKEELILLNGSIRLFAAFGFFDGEVKEIGRLEKLIEGTSHFLYSDDPAYPGIVYWHCGGGKTRFDYITLRDGALVQENLWWTDNNGFVEDGEPGRITEISSDKRLIELSGEAYEKNQELKFPRIPSIFEEDAKNTYLEFLKDARKNSEPGFYSFRDINFDDLEELITLKNGKITVYTFLAQTGKMTEVGSHELGEGTVSLLYPSESYYDGIFCLTASDEQIRCGYLVLQEEGPAFEELWTEELGTDKFPKRVTEHSDDTEKIESSRTAREKGQTIEIFPIGNVDKT